MSFKTWAARKIFSDVIKDVAAPKKSSNIEIAPAKALGLRLGDTTSKDFEEPEFDLKTISTAYNTDGYIRQGVDKYVDQIFKEGYELFGKDENVTAYITMRLQYMARVTNQPYGQFYIDIVDDVVKYSNCIIAKARMTDQSQLPPGVSITGINGLEPIVGYYCLNVPSMQVKRDKNGIVQSWQQLMDGNDKGVKFKPEDIIHIYYKREKGNAFGTPILLPVLDDVRALRQAEESVLRLIYRNVYPFYHIAVGSKEIPGGPNDVTSMQNDINNMDLEGGIVTTERAVIKAIASNQVINAEPYLRYLEDRVFSDMGIPAILFGRGDTANRSTGDNMTSEMSDRIKAIQKTVELFINTYIINDLLLEGGYDPYLNPDQQVVFRFKENDLDTKIKSDNQAIFEYEHNSITEDEMRSKLGMDPITDRSKMFQTLVTQANAAALAALKPQTGTSSSTSNQTGTKATNNKVKPTNQYKTKTSPKKTTNSEVEQMRIKVLDCIINNTQIDDSIVCNKDYSFNNLNDGYISVMCQELLSDLQDYQQNDNLIEKIELINASIDLFAERISEVIK